MKQARFSPKEAIQFGWQTEKANWAFFATVFSIMLGANIILSMVENSVGINARGLIQLLTFLMNSILTLGLVRIALKFLAGQSASITDVYMNYRYLWRYVGATIIYSFILFGASLPFLICLVVLASHDIATFGVVATTSHRLEYALLLILFLWPATYLGIMYQFYPFYIVEGQTRAVASLKASAAITAGSRRSLFLFTLVLAFINGLALIPYGLAIYLVSSVGLNPYATIPFLFGFLVTVPLTWLAQVHVFRQLREGRGVTKQP